MSDILSNESVEFNVRKSQAIELDIDVQNDMTQEYIEHKITQKLESGMSDLKNILDEISLLKS